MNGIEPTDGQLLGEFLDDACQRAFEVLVGRHGAMVAGVCRRVTGRPSDAEDAAQAVFAQLASAAPTLRDRRSIAGWLHRTAWHVSLRARRAVAARQRLERLEGVRAGEAVAEDAAEAEVMNAEARRELDRALGLLAEEYREALVLHHLEGMTVSQVAELLGCPPGTVAARLSRGRSLLRERLRWRGFVLVVGTQALSARVAEAVAGSMADAGAGPDAGAGDMGPAGDTWPADESWPVEDAGAGQVRRPLAALPLSPLEPSGGAGVGGAAWASPAAAASPSAVAAVASPGWFAFTGGPAAAALVAVVGTTTSAALLAAGHLASPESRSPVSVVSASPAGVTPLPNPMSLPANAPHSAAGSVYERPADDTRSTRSSRSTVSSGGGGSGPIGVLPEPSSLALVAIGGAALLRRRR